LLCMQWLQLWQRQKRTFKEELRQVKDLWILGNTRVLYFLRLESYIKILER
jgi:hypothetical protein